MTVSSETNSVQYTGNGSLVTYAYPFKIFETSDLTVTLDGTTTTSYSVTGAGDDSGGNIVFYSAPGDGVVITIRRVLPVTQETDYVENAPFQAESHENALDKLTMIAQQLTTDSNKSLKYPNDDSATLSSILPDATTRATKVLGFDSDGEPSLTESTLAEIDASIAAAREDGTLITSDSFVGDGSTVDYNISSTPVNKYGLLVQIGGATQEPSSYGVINSVVTFTEAPPNGVPFTIRNLGYQIGSYDPGGGETKYLSDYADLNDALTKLGSTVTTFVIDEAFTLSTNTTIPKNISLDWQAGCVASGAYTLTINGALTAGEYQLFGSDIILNGLLYAEVKWFGAVGDGVVDDSAAIQKTYNSNASIVNFSNTQSSYIVNTELTYPSTLKLIKGNGSILTEASGAKFCNATGLINVTFKDITLRGSLTGSELSTYKSFILENSSNITLHNIKFIDCWVNPIELIGVSNFKVGDCLFSNCSNGPEFRGCSYGDIYNNILDGSKQTDSIFKVGISLQTYHVTYGINSNIKIRDNIVKDLGSSQGILGHGGIDVIVSNNIITNCSMGIDFNRYSGTIGNDNIENLIVTNNLCVGVGSSVTYTPDAEGGIAVISSSPDVVNNVIVSNNVVYDFNNKLQANNQGGIRFTKVYGLIVSDNVVYDCTELGVGFSGEASKNINVVDNVIYNITGAGDAGAIKIDSGVVATDIVTGVIKNNEIYNSFTSFRIEGTNNNLAVYDTSDESSNDNVTSTTTACIFNKTLVHTAQTNPSVKREVSVVNLTASAYNLTDLTDPFRGQLITLFASNAVVIKDVSTGGNFRTSTGIDFTFTSNDTITFIYNGSNWLEVSRSIN